MTNGKRRHQLFIDRKLQGALLVHAAIYWFYCLFSVTLIAVCWIIFTTQPESSAELFGQLWTNCGPALLGSVLLLPLVLLDCLRLSNRFAGPMVRMQKAMRQLAAGETPAAIQLRPGDFWTEFAEDVNTVSECCRQLGTTTTPNSSAEANASDVKADPPASGTRASISAPSDASSVVPPLDSEATAQSIYSDLSI